MTGSEANAPLSVKPITCEKCRADIPILAQAQTRFVGCVQCGAYYEVTRLGNQYRKTFTNDRAGKSEPVWKLGTRVTLRDTKYAVVGFVVKKEETENVYWREYVLFNPMHGYAYLAEYNGHWILLKTATEHPTFGKKMRHSFDLEGESYQLYHRYTAQVVFAQGEFYYDITDSGNYTEYVSPPWMMTRELRKKEVGWYKGEYVAPADLAKASQEAAKIPPRIGIGACQPNHVTQQYQETLRVSLVALLLLLLLQGWLVSSARKNEVLRESYDLQDSIVASSYPATSAKPLITPSFSLKEGTKNMEVELYSAVDNSWFEAEMTLVNEATGAERDLNMGVEYYHGYEDGEYWTEGEQRTEEVLSAVPEGSYHLVIVPSKPASFAHVEVRVRRDVPTWSNFCIAIVLLAILPAIQYYRKYRFEKQRWMNSDYSPYDE